MNGLPQHEVPPQRVFLYLGLSVRLEDPPGDVLTPKGADKTIEGLLITLDRRCGITAEKVSRSKKVDGRTVRYFGVAVRVEQFARLHAQPQLNDIVYAIEAPIARTPPDLYPTARLNACCDGGATIFYRGLYRPQPFSPEQLRFVAGLLKPAQK